MRRVKRTVVVIGILLARAPAASADAAPAPVSAPATAPARLGLAVVALAGAAGAAWPLARSVYADSTLRPGAVDEPHARVLCGEAPAATAGAELRDLSDTVAAVRDDDAPSRALLDGIARRFAVRALVVVRSDEGHPTARLFLAETGAFDAAVYAPDDPTAPSPAWSATTRSLDRLFGSASAPALATRKAPKREPPTREAPARPFYESAWFWGAVGAAALVGGAAYIATRDSTPSTIHLEVQVPH